MVLMPEHLANSSDLMKVSKNITALKTKKEMVQVMSRIASKVEAEASLKEDGRWETEDDEHP